MAEKITVDAMSRKVERIFVRIIAQYANPAARPRIVSPVLPLPGPETHCWTYAWEYAKSHPGTRYVEGICRRPSRPGTISPHAWIEEDTPFGVRIRELTETYEDAYDYRGLAISTNVAIADEAVGDDGTRFSILQIALLASGGDPLAALSHLALNGA